MLRGLLCLITLSLFQVTLFAQCTPSLTGPFGDIVPDTSTNLPPALAGVAYNTSVQFFIPADTIAAGLGTVTVTDFTLDSISGLPPAFTIASNPASGIFPGGSAGCTQISGPVPHDSITGVYPLTFYITAHVTALNIPYPISVTGYQLLVGDMTGLSLYNGKPDNFILVSGSDFSPPGFIVSSDFSGKLMVEVWDLSGRLELKSGFVVMNGDLVLLPRFSDGLYILRISSETKVLFSGKLPVTSR